LKHVREVREIIGVARIQGQAGSNRRGSDEQIKRAAPSRFAARRGDCCVHAAVRSSHGRIDWERIESRLCSLKAILTTSPFRRIRGRVRPSRELRHRDRGDSELAGQLARIDQSQIDHD
jgi:hypothetical protein